MRILVDDMPCYKDECPFIKYEISPFRAGKEAVREWCSITREDCDLSLKTGCRTTCSGLSIITDDRVMRYD